MRKIKEKEIESVERGDHLLLQPFHNRAIRQQAQGQDRVKTKMKPQASRPLRSQGLHPNRSAFKKGVRLQMTKGF